MSRCAFGFLYVCISSGWLTNHTAKELQTCCSEVDDASTSAKVQATASDLAPGLTRCGDETGFVSR